MSWGLLVLAGIFTAMAGGSLYGGVTDRRYRTGYKYNQVPTDRDRANGSMTASVGCFMMGVGLIAAGSVGALVSVFALTCLVAGVTLAGHSSYIRQRIRVSEKARAEKVRQDHIRTAKQREANETVRQEEADRAARQAEAREAARQREMEVRKQNGVLAAALSQGVFVGIICSVVQPVEAEGERRLSELSEHIRTLASIGGNGDQPVPADLRQKSEILVADLISVLEANGPVDRKEAYRTPWTNSGTAVKDWRELVQAIPLTDLVVLGSVLGRFVKLLKPEVRRQLPQPHAEDDTGFAARLNSALTRSLFVKILFSQKLTTDSLNAALGQFLAGHELRRPYLGEAYFSRQTAGSEAGEGRGPNEVLAVPGLPYWEPRSRFIFGLPAAVVTALRFLSTEFQIAGVCRLEARVADEGVEDDRAIEIDDDINNEATDGADIEEDKCPAFGITVPSLFAPYRIPYTSLRVSHEVHEITTSFDLPADTQIVRRRFQHQRADGQRDRRYADNPLIYTARIPVISLESPDLPEGTSISILTSSLKTASDVQELLASLRGGFGVTPALGPESPGSIISNPRETAVGAIGLQKQEIVLDSQGELLATKRLKELIGLNGVKKEVQALVNLVRIRQARLTEGLQVAEQSNHLVFTGNPGTGKTTVARIVAEIYRELGLVTKGHLIETDRSGLVAGYVGQTAIKTKAIFDSARGGVLFIDEAYSLARSDYESDFGYEAVDTLLKLMEDYRTDTAVVVAGYTEEMDRFLLSNPGLRSRFGRTIEFRDYDSFELMQIFDLLCRSNSYRLAVDTRTTLLRVFESADTSGNGRFVRNLFEDSVARQANRLAQRGGFTRDDLMILIPADIDPHIRSLRS